MITTVLIDIDGTICVGPQLIDGAGDVINWMHSKGLRIIYFTNDSSRSRSQISERLRLAGLDCSKDDIISSGFMAANYVSKNNLENVYISGTDGLKDEFKDCGIPTVNPENANTLIIGMDPDYNYKKMKDAINIAIKAKTIIACNNEKVFRCSNDMICPGCGAMVSSISYCSSKSPDVVIGKPNPYMLEYVLFKYNLNKDEILIVGDTPESDIAMADKFGSRSVLVNTNGSLSIKDLPAVIEKII